MRNGFLDDELRQIRLLGLALLLWHGSGPEGQAHLVHRTADGGHQCGAEGDVGGMGHVEDHAQTALDACHVVGGKLSYLIAQRAVVHVQLTDEVRKLARIDLHRTRGGAEAVGGTGLIAVILILFLQRGQALGVGARGLQFAYLTLHGDTHAA